MSNFERISKHMWMMHAEHETDRPILSAVVGTRRTLLIDGGASAKHAEAFRGYLLEQGCRLPDLLVLTHWHWDHSFGSAAWGVPILAHHKTAEALRVLDGFDGSDPALQAFVDKLIISEASAADIRNEYGKQRNIVIAMPDILFEDELFVDLGDVGVEIRHVGGDHSSDSCLVYVREDRVLHLGDALGPSVYGGPRSYTSESLLRLSELTKQYDAEVYIESHALPVGQEAFYQELGEWEYLARAVQEYGDRREEVEKRLLSFFHADALTKEQTDAVSLFMEGMKRLKGDR